jgi:acetyl-CoA acetyltransferase
VNSYFIRTCKIRYVCSAKSPCLESNVQSKRSVRSESTRIDGRTANASATAIVLAPSPLAWAADPGADLVRTNVNGGAIAIGHPLGASGARIMTTLMNALKQRGGRYGLQTMYEGGGMANATIIERLG